jgi:GTP-binding protein YchF
MPPKKAPVAEKKIILGRASNTLSLGLVGMPNVGKSTTYNVISNLQVPAENFPFCTIDPNTARVEVPEPRVEKMAAIYNPKKKIYANISITDIAGLVRGASTGAGLGNAFLSHIQGVDGIFHVVRAFDNEEIIHEEGDVNPIRDMETINGELIAKDLQHIEKRMPELEKLIARKNLKPDRDERDLLLKVEAMLKEGKWIKDGEWVAKEIDGLNHHNLLTAKPVIYLVNIGYDDYVKKKNRWLPKVAEWIKNNGGGPMIPYSADYEKAVMMNGADQEARKATAAELGAPSIVNKIIKTGYHTLQLVHYFTGGPDEVRCWTIRQGTKAPGAAGVIHTDFERGFICAEIIKYNDLIEHGSEAAVKAEGLMQQKGKDYEVADGDIIFFKFNVGPKAKK